MRKTLIIKCGTTLPDLVARRGDFEDWFITAGGYPPGEALVIDVTRETTLPVYDEFAGVIVTGSHAMVTEHHPWSERTARWLAASVDKVPMLGVCYGHQLLGYALGGRVDDNPNGREMGMVEVTPHAAAADDPLLGALDKPFLAPVSHKQSLLTLPNGATLLAASARDMHQAFRFGECTWGLQFHPEFDADIAATYVDFCHTDLVAEGQQPEALKQSCVDSSVGRDILRRFRQLTIEKESEISGLCKKMIC